MVGVLQCLICRWFQVLTPPLGLASLHSNVEIRGNCNKFMVGAQKHDFDLPLIMHKLSFVSVQECQECPRL